MAGVLSMIGAISALFVLFPYVLVMWLTNAQRVVAFAVISVVLLALSSQGFDLSHSLLDQFLQGIWSFVGFALMLGWFVCGFVHAAVVAVAGFLQVLLSFCHGSGSQAAPTKD